MRRARWTLTILTSLVLGGCAAPLRSVHDRRLVSHDPALRIEAGEGFAYLGRVPFTLGADFEGERHLFGDLRGDTLQRLLVIQFERVRPGSAESYRYDMRAAEPLGSRRFLNNSFAFPGATASVASPRDEAERTNNFLIARRLRMPAVWLTTRFVTIADDRRSEVIVFYMEGRRDLSMTDLYAGEDPTPEWQAMKTGLAARGRSAFTID
jgi:hypothetical protein